MKTSYNLKKRTTKTEHFEKYLKMYIINLKFIRYRLTDSSNIIDLVRNYKLKRPVSNLRLPKKTKWGKISKLKKKLS